MAMEIRQQFPISETAKVCDYGCGSLRIGAHFITSQAPGSYFGIDVSEDFIAYGKELLGEQLLLAKRPRLGKISTELDEVAAAGVDLLFSTDVASHVHPDEKPEYFDNIKKIVHRTGSAAVILAITAERTVRYQRSGWAWPLGYYEESMRPLSLTKDRFRKTIVRNGYKLNSIMLTFQREA
ncbi:class I SAM-dependent methyltransferase [Mesorhizobium sp. LHD-90]|uniref:class I SAM-dependent methyltransferase n=1 Tax=Mesorhizobium sp. LHD-90 TaxID=3071414 RepID=UPI0027E1049D|nr:class I SAM-dependent methyltransferase [Mesorhizobium sp. LHD-90]MDQ6437583.1 class I SAM-dependent methyltransferase [Mesorhizobium sp. LHD-90]